MSKFQLIFVAVFVVFIVGGVAAFATYKSTNQDTTLPSIEVWGTVSQDTFNQLLQEVNRSQTQQIQVNYVEKTPASFDKDFITTLARGGGPDAVLLPQDLIFKHRDKILTIPYTTISQRDFMDTYVQESEKYIDSSGILALPLMIDPLVMFVNKDMFTNAGLAVYPKQWNEFDRLTNLLTQKDNKGNVRRSAIALGEFSNLTHAREVLGTILLQAGNPVTVVTGDGLFRSALGYDDIKGAESTAAGLSFFNQFSNPSQPNYSWNRSLPSSFNSFLGGKLATYFGFASEITSIRTKNPNLNFDIAPMPQP
ncbi:extracellular solute-binding protein, partial [bacterium]|nr:extracellular solute-binding protein [bacterium]